MRIRILISGILILIAPLARAARRPPHTWAVIAGRDLDARIRRHIESLAANDQALIRYFASARDAGHVRLRPGDLTLEIIQEKDPISYRATLRLLSGDAGKTITPELAREGYDLSVTYPRGTVPNRIRITASAPTGFHHALMRIPDLLRLPPEKVPSHLFPNPKLCAVTRAAGAAVVTLADFPSFPERGIVEGFYGTPWGHQDRLDMLRFEGQHGMNVYYYAPKNDPYHRKLWRDPYPPEEQKQLGELVMAARANFVDFCFAISPGLSMTYSSDDDFKALTAKLDGVAKLGTSCFALFLDDVPQELQNPQDLEQFKTLAAAHASVINRLDDHLKEQSPANRLVVTPTTYTNLWGSRDYIRDLGTAVNPDVELVWTGPEVASPVITLEQAKEWGDYLRRKPLIWDNFPVNDGRSWRVHLGPLRDRDARLPEAVGGLISNAMNQPRASMIPLATIADYLWNPAAYDPERSLANAVTDQYGKDAPRLLAPILKIYGDYWWDENVFTPLFQERRYPIDVPEIERKTAQLETALKGIQMRGGFQRLYAELEPFPGRIRERLAKLRTDPTFEGLADGRLQWREDYAVLTAPRISSPVAHDGEFAKWRAAKVYDLNAATQIVQGSKWWKGPDQFSARVAFGWDEKYFYVGVDVSNAALCQPFTGRGIENGDAFTLTLETAFRKHFESTRPMGDEYRLLFSPGNFAGVEPSIYSDEDYLPPRAQPHNYAQEISTAWKRTANGFSGDIAIPVSFFEGKKFSEGYEIGIEYGAQKVFPEPGKGIADKESRRIVFSSKAAQAFHARLTNPSSYQRLVLGK
ncbi:MAG: beta-N-acetylglucosaminidase domain-containing protein [Terriglobia bacterium]